MTDKERLGSIKSQPLNMVLDGLSDMDVVTECVVDYRDYLWLIEQAEQVTTLESYMNTLAKYGDVTRNQLLEVKKENKKLREALENISFVYEDTGDIAYDRRGMFVIAKIALEEQK